MAQQSLTFLVLSAEHDLRQLMCQVTGAAVGQGANELYNISFPGDVPPLFWVENLIMRVAAASATPVAIVEGDVAEILVIRDNNVIWGESVRAANYTV